eukprot:TRINITY_DN7960_c0_g1_i4.p1 TRINITY_DN7960_c0_g1~~TRINITY_DN7960_c0_g1_i4.p1  ORF type:complete len:444 (-),score=68.97 TRINITY_DN7960_c0_g1_i4:156-1319(-)
MSYPAEGVECAYRNDINDVSYVLQSLHKDKYHVYNLTERQYDSSKFDGNVSAWCGWPDHYSPPLITLTQLMKSIHSFLSADPENVVAVHCLAGKGRTGTVIASYLLYSGLFKEAVHAKNYFAFKRSQTNWGVVGPAQLRYVDYFADLLARGMPPMVPLKLKSIIMNKVPHLYLGPSKGSGCTPILQLKDYNLVKIPQPLIWENAENKTYIVGMQNISFDLADVVIKGDVLFEMYHHNWGRSDLIAMIAFNTAMVHRDHSDLRVRFTKSEIDVVNKDKRFPHDFWMEFVLEPVPPNTHLTVPMDEMATVDNNFWHSVLRSNRRSVMNGENCFFRDAYLQEKLLDAQRFQQQTISLNSPSSFLNRGGWLTKQEKHKIFNIHNSEVNSFY